MSETDYGYDKAACIVLDACVCSHASLSRGQAQADGMTAATASCK
jgi:hypothetical protein